MFDGVPIGTNISFNLSPLGSFFCCFFLAFGYVLSLYINRSDEGRDHPRTIKIRFLAVTVACFLAIPYMYMLATNDSKGFTLMQWLGIKWRGLIPGAVFPLLLTMILFLGPLVQRYDAGVLGVYRGIAYWKKSLTNVYWIRNHIMAPVTEEFLFRACLIPLMVPTFGWQTAVVFCPIFFGLAHFHHMLQQIKFEGLELQAAFFQQLFQFCYTTAFGSYCAFIFVRTGHLIGPILCHTFCNHMGLPDINDIFNEHDFERKARVIFAYLLGPVLFCLLLNVLTAPILFGNDVYYGFVTKPM